ncbi:hypothetical protein MASR2M39_05320 [Ignavibacteriales bacterium]
MSNKKALKDGGTVPVVDSNAVKKDTIAAPDTAKNSTGTKRSNENSFDLVKDQDHSSCVDYNGFAISFARDI